MAVKGDTWNYKMGDNKTDQQMEEKDGNVNITQLITRKPYITSTMFLSEQDRYNHILENTALYLILHPILLRPNILRPQLQSCSLKTLNFVIIIIST